MISVQAPPRAAYLHIPFCRHRCGYCNFTVLAGHDDLTEAFLQALELELQQLKSPHPVDTLFIGGGTPSYLALPGLERLMDLANFWFPLSDGGEFTIEVNPEDFDEQKAACAAANGVTRTSIGIQSFQSTKRIALDRQHDDAMIDQVISTCEKANFDLACDLIFAAPNETAEIWQSDLDAMTSRAPSHISTYGLTWEKGTRFWNDARRGEQFPIDEELEREMFTTARCFLREAGYEHYEISNYARPGKRCRHNEVYWRCDPYFAAGPGAASYVDGVRKVNHRSATTWINKVIAGEDWVAETETISPELAAREKLVFGLRQLDGIVLEDFVASSGFQVDQLAGEALERFVDASWLTRDAQRLALTDEGILISDALWPDLLG